MKTKPFLIAIFSVISIISLLFVAGCFHKEKADKKEVIAFLDKFSDDLNKGDADDLRKMFAVKMPPKTLNRLLGVLTGKKDFLSKEKPFAAITLDVDASDIKSAGQDLVIADVKAELTHLDVEKRISLITIKIRKVNSYTYKIVRIDARKLLSDYTEYANYIKNKNAPAKDMFSAITLAAFKTAEQLKTKYDSVIWFDYIDGKTFYYVVKGKWVMEKDLNKTDPSYKDSVIAPYKMGLVNPDLKEIIPPDYDLIHNINGTIDGLVEVEKDEKKGLYNLDGKLVVPVNYDAIYPLKSYENTALLRNGDDYFYLKKDLTLSDKISGLKIEEALPFINIYGSSYVLSDASSKNVMEYNSREKYNSIVIPPSYLVELQILPKTIDFQNPIRRTIAGEDEMASGDTTYDIKFGGSQKKEGNWFESIYYSVVDSYLGGRSGLYATKKLVMVDKKQNKLLSFSADNFLGDGEGGGDLSSDCNENALKAIDDTLFEFKTTSDLEAQLYNKDEYAVEGPYYHYLHLKNGKLEALGSKRKFPSTQYVKMDDSYLAGCFKISTYASKNSSPPKVVDHMTPDLLRYMKNEIYASYNYKFKDKQWNEAFQYSFGRDSVGKNVSVDDSLTAIEKYNIQWINSKLNKPKENRVAAR